MGRPLLPQIFNTSFQAGKLRKTLSFFLVNLLFLFATQAQTVTIPIGNTSTDPGNTNISRKPFGSFRGFERSAMIYTSSEIGMSGTLSSIGFFVNALNSPAASTPVVIYVKQTAATSFTAPTLVPTEESGATVVFNGVVTSGMLSVNNWVTIPLSPTFTYSTASNLEIIIETNAGGTGNEGDNAKKFNFQDTGISQFQYWQSDGGSPESFGFTGVLSTFRPNVQLTFGTPAQTCDAPSGLTATNITSSSATLGFTGSSTGATGTYTVQYGLDGFADGAGTTVASPYNISGLTANTVYDFTVQKNCGASGNSTIVRGTFTTSAAAQTCDPATSLSVTNITSTSASLNFTASSTGGSGTYTVEYGPTGFTPGSGTITTGVTTSPLNISGLTPSTTYQFYVTKNCGATIGNSSTAGPVSFTTSAAAQACEPPTNLNATNVTNTTASLNFNVSATGFTGTYTVEYGTNGFTPGTGTSVSGLTTSPYNVSGLSPNTAYQFYVYKNCGLNGTSNFAGPASFTTTATPPTCDAPTIVSATNVTNTTATINFTPSSTGAAGTYVIEYGPDGFTLGSGTIVSNITSSPYTLTGLTPDTDYDFYIRKNCGVSVGFSSNSGPGGFNTLLNPPACVAGTWTGTVSTDWHTAGNWCNSQLPTSTTDVIIPSGTPFSPIITANAETRNLTINSGATLTINGPSPNPPTINAITLTVNGLLTNNGTFTNTSGNGTIIFTSNDLQTIGQSGQTTVFFDLTTGPGGATLAGAVSIRHLLTLNGSLNTNSQAFTLLADAAFQAMVVNNNGTVNGTTKMERYINPGINSSLGYRHLASPVAATTVADLADPGVTIVVNSAYNASPTPSTVRPFPTIFRYNETRLTAATATTSAFTFGWESPTTTADPMTPGRAFTVNMPPVEVNFNGTLNNGTVPVGLLTRGATANSGWHFLGNPYPSPIDWDLAIVPSGLDNAIYVYRSTGQYTGQYASYTNGVGTPNTDLIASCQGFFVRVNSGTPTFNFTNSMRVTSYENPALYRKTETRPLVALALQNQNGESDDVYVYFEAGATASFDSQYDAYKLPNSGTAPVLYSMVNTDAASINGLPLPIANTLVHLGAWVNAAGTYTFNANKVLNLAGTLVMLEDHLTGNVVNLQQQPTYTFTTSLTDLSGRFFLRFGPSTTTGIAESELAARTLVYPNPNRGEFTLSMQLKETKNVQVSLFNAIGQHVWEQTFKPNSLHLKENVTLDKLPVGIYMLSIKTSEGVIQKKLVIE